jgi:hypothetical protein
MKKPSPGDQTVYCRRAGNGGAVIPVTAARALWSNCHKCHTCGTPCHSK